MVPADAFVVGVLELMSLSGVLSDTPWVKPTLVSLLAGGAIWFLASIPARWLLLLVAPLVRQSRTWIQNVRSFFGARRISRLRAIEQQRDYLSAGSRRIIDVTAAATWSGAVEGATVRIGTAVEALRSNERELRQGTVAIEKAQKRFARLDRAANLVPNITGADDLRKHLQAHRSASLQFYGSILFAIPIIFANSILSSRVFTELGISARSVFGVALPLAYVLAVMLVLLEGGFGWLHGVAKDREEGDERRITVGEVACTLAALAVIAFETALYSLVIPAELASVFSIPGIPQGSAFGLLGALLGGAVFGLGTVIYSSLATRRRSLTPRALNRDLKRLNRSADDWNSLITQLTAKQSQLGAALQRSQELGGHQSDVSAFVERLHVQFERHVTEIPEWAAPADRTADPHDVRDRETRCSIWAIVSLLAIVVGTIMWANSAGEVGSRAVGIGLGFSLLFLCCGLVLGHTIAPWVALESSVRPQLKWSARATAVAAFTPAVLTLAVFGLLAVILPAHRLLWASSIPVAMLLIVAGRETGTLLSLIPIEFLKLRGSALTALEFTLLCAAFALYVVVLVLYGILYVLAAPILSLWPIRRAVFADSPVVTTN